jgi:hypothetical protein
MTQATKLLKAYANAPMGLTDEEAGLIADLSHTGYWKRCSDLRNLGYIATLVIAGHEVTRATSCGVQSIVCWITEEGEQRLKSLDQ